MSLGKLPGIKGLVVASASGSQQNKRRFKSDLSVDMISPPLGDFRHTMHVGRGGDVFGDTSFLSNHGGNGGANGGGGGGGERGGERAPAGSPGSPTGSTKTTRFFTRTLRQVRKLPAPPPRPRAGSRDLSMPPPPISPIIKNAISLPQLNMDLSNGSCVQRTLFPSSESTTDEPLYRYGQAMSGYVTLPRLSRVDRQSQEDTFAALSPDFGRGSLLDSGNNGGGGGLQPSDSLTSLTFTVDLGPSLMSEVLGMFDSPDSNFSGWDKAPATAGGGGGGGAGDQDGGEQRISAFESLSESTTRRYASTTTTTTTTSSTTGFSAESSPYNGSLRSSSPEWGGSGGGGGCGGGGEQGGVSKTANGGGELVVSRGDVSQSQKIVADASLWSPAPEDPGIEAGRFREAVDVLSRHYGGGMQQQQQNQNQRSLRGGPGPRHTGKDTTLYGNSRRICYRNDSYTYQDDEDEVKV
ncbi:cdc42 effector protein 1-like [Engraulis encrasicolus]|uniref:cdc42 effector protein 1-like n=1 Tax=Engraulis encrasicolus TaxID=184585 RepID=UPI002FCE7D94